MAVLTPKRKGLVSNACDHSLHISDEYIHVWEHACLLFYHSDWDSALQTFNMLEPWTSCLHIKAVLLLNVAIIACNLGAYTEAREALIRAVACWDTFPMSFFLLGIVNYELHHFSLAHAAFKFASLLLQRAGIETLDHRPAGLDYLLTAAHLMNNELSSGRARGLEDKVDRIYPLLHRLPAGLIFINPRAGPIEAACEIQTAGRYVNQFAAEPQPSDYQTAIAHNERQPSPTAEVGATSKLKFRQQKSKSLRRLLASLNEPYSPGPNPEQKCSQGPDVESSQTFTTRLADQELDLYRSEPKGFYRDTLDTSMKRFRIAPSNNPHSISVHRRVSAPTRMVARDARTDHTPLHEMASFLRHTGPEFAKSIPRKSIMRPVENLPRRVITHYEPRDARAQPENLREFSMFMRDTGPDSTFPVMREDQVEPCDVRERGTPVSPQQISNQDVSKQLIETASLLHLTRSSSVYSRPTDYADDSITAKTPEEEYYFFPVPYRPPAKKRSKDWWLTDAEHPAYRL